MERNYTPNTTVVLGDMDKTIENKNIDINFIKLKYEIAGCQCIAINKKSYYEILNYMIMFNEIGYTGDTMINYLQQNNIVNVYSMYPNIAYQERTNLKPYTIE
jgi:hypothetical protein